MELEREGLEELDISFTDNKPVLDLFLSKPIGLVSLLNDQCRGLNVSHMTSVGGSHMTFVGCRVTWPLWGGNLTPVTVYVGMWKDISIIIIIIIIGNWRRKIIISILRVQRKLLFTSARRVLWNIQTMSLTVATHWCSLSSTMQEMWVNRSKYNNISVHTYHHSCLHVYSCYTWLVTACCNCIYRKTSNNSATVILAPTSTILHFSWALIMHQMKPSKLFIQRGCRHSK